MQCHGKRTGVPFLCTPSLTSGALVSDIVGMDQVLVAAGVFNGLDSARKALSGRHFNR